MRKDNIDLTAKWYDYFFLLRPILWVPVWVFLFLGYMYGSLKPTFSFDFLLNKKFWLTLIIYTLLMSSTYIINQIVDKDSDFENDKLFLIPYDIISVKNAVIFAAILAVVSITSAFLIGGSVLLILFIISLIMGLLYSVPPFQVKARPFIDIAFNAIGYGVIAFLVGWYTVSNISLHGLATALGYFLLVSAIFVNTTIPDIPGDKKTGKITTGVYLGKKNALLFSTALFALTLIYSFLETDLLLIVPSFLGLVFSISSLWDDSQDLILTKLSYRVPSFIFVLLVSIKFPLFLAINLILLFILRKYYKTRFDLDYPSIMGR